VKRKQKISKPTPAVGQVSAAREAVGDKLAALHHLQLLTRHEIIALTGVTYPTIWQWMREGKFPRPRIAGGKSAWLASEVEAWLAGLPTRRFKPPEDDEPEAA
jgi:prophage regulatory protein